MYVQEFITCKIATPGIPTIKCCLNTLATYLPSNLFPFADIPLTPKERSLLTGEGNNEPTGVRASHSSESVLDAPDTPPPKPARPNRYA